MDNLYFTAIVSPCPGALSDSLAIVYGGSAFPLDCPHAPNRVNIIEYLWGQDGSLATHVQSGNGVIGELGKLGFVATNQALCGMTGWVIKNNLAIKWDMSGPANWSLNSCQ